MEQEDSSLSNFMIMLSVILHPKGGSAFAVPCAEITFRKSLLPPAKQSSQHLPLGHMYLRPKLLFLPWWSQLSFIPHLVFYLVTGRGAEVLFSGNCIFVPQVTPFLLAKGYRFPVQRYLLASCCNGTVLCPSFSPVFSSRTIELSLELDKRKTFLSAVLAAPQL